MDRVDGGDERHNQPPGHLLLILTNTTGHLLCRLLCRPTKERAPNPNFPLPLQACQIASVRPRFGPADDHKILGRTEKTNAAIQPAGRTLYCVTPEKGQWAKRPGYRSEG